MFFILKFILARVEVLKIYLCSKQQHKAKTSLSQYLMHSQKGSCYRRWVKELVGQNKRHFPVLPSWRESLFHGWPNAEALRLSLETSALWVNLALVYGGKLGSFCLEMHQILSHLQGKDNLRSQGSRFLCFFCTSPVWCAGCPMLRSGFILRTVCPGAKELQKPTSHPEACMSFRLPHILQMPFFRLAGPALSSTGVSRARCSASSKHSWGAWCCLCPLLCSVAPCIMPNLVLSVFTLLCLYPVPLFSSLPIPFSIFILANTDMYQSQMSTFMLQSYLSHQIIIRIVLSASQFLVSAVSSRTLMEINCYFGVSRAAAL